MKNHYNYPGELTAAELAATALNEAQHLPGAIYGFAAWKVSWRTRQ